MKINRVAVYHIVGWVLYMIYSMVGSFAFTTYGEIPLRVPAKVLLNLSYLISQAAVFYYMYLLLMPQLFRPGRLWVFVAGTLLTPLLFIVIRYSLEEVLYPATFGFRNYHSGTTVSYYILDNVYRGVPPMAIAVVVWLGLHAYHQQMENKSLREEKVKAELAFLKSQINPHFLYNTLNYIYSLAYPVSDHLADAIIKLSQLMRYMLTESSDGFVDLQKEVDYIANYIDIYELRFGENFHVNFHTEGVIGGQRIASLILIPFVENAFKHGVVDDASRPVKIILKVTGNRMEFTVSNKVSHQQKDHSSGVGLVNIRRRLELIYPGNHELLISANSQTYKSTLYITF